MVSQLTIKKQQMMSGEKYFGDNSPLNPSPEIWKPNMRTIAEGEAHTSNAKGKNK